MGRGKHPSMLPCPCFLTPHGLCGRGRGTLKASKNAVRAQGVATVSRAKRFQLKKYSLVSFLGALEKKRRFCNGVLVGADVRARRDTVTMLIERYGGSNWH